MRKHYSSYASDTIATIKNPPLLSNVNLNDYKVTGNYYFGTGCTNSPNNLNYIMVSVLSVNDNNVLQIAYKITATTAEQIGFTRAYANGGWTAWQKLAVEADIGWKKHIDVATGATVSLPTKFNELNVSVLVNNNNSDCYTFHIVKADLPSFGRIFRNGQYAGTNDWARVNLWGSSTQMYVANAQRNGVEYKTGSTMTIYYR